MSSTDTKLPFGLKGEKIVHVSEVERGLACGCVCPSCGAPLVARKGSKVIYHFAHYNAPECSTALETALHLLAKDILAEEKRLMLPPLVVDIEGFKCEVLPAKSFEFDSVELEYRMEGMIPDVVLYKGKHRLIVEIAVTHFVDDEKMRKIEKAGISAIEVDLKHLLKGGFSRIILQNEITKIAKHKKWLYNARTTQLIEKFVKHGKLQNLKEARGFERRDLIFERDEQEFGTWEKREQFYAQYCISVTKRTLDMGFQEDIELEEIENCLQMVHFNQRNTSASLSIHCASCRYYRGIRKSAHQHAIVCLAPHYLKTRGYLEKQLFIRD